MSLSTYLSGSRGRAAALARQLGVHPVVVSCWRTGTKPVPVNRCLAIELATQGAVTRRDLRPNDCEQIWPDLALEATHTARRARKKAVSGAGLGQCHLPFIDADSHCAVES